MRSMHRRFRDRFQDLWAARSTKATATRRRTNRASFSTFGGAEQLEQRALLAGVTAEYVDDWTQTSHVGLARTYGNTGVGMLVLTIDAGLSGGDDVFLRVENNQYIFSTDATFTNTIASYPGTYTRSYSLLTTDPDFSKTPTAPAVFTPYTSAFYSIYVKCVGLRDGVDTPSFTVVGASQDVKKTLMVDFQQDNGTPLSESAVAINSPVTIRRVKGDATAADEFLYPLNNTLGNRDAAVGAPLSFLGGAYFRAESVSVRAAIDVVNNLFLSSEIGDDSVTRDLSPTGLSISQSLHYSYSGASSDRSIFQATVQGTAFNVNAGASIVCDASAKDPSSLTVNVQDADVRIAGSMSAANLSFFLMPSAGLPANAVAHTITTRSASTGTQAGTISGNQLLIYLANDAATGADGSVDLQAGVSNLRITSSADTLANTLDYSIKISNNKALLVDSVAASKGDISLATTTGTVTLQAAIDTVGSFSLSSGADLTVDSAITSGKNISLTSTAGSVTTNAALKTSEAATSNGQIVVTASKDVTINSLVQAEFDGVRITATTGQIVSGANYALDPTSRIAGTSATLKAATGIVLGTSVGSLTAAVSGKGNLVIDDNGSAGQFTVASATSADGSVAIRAVRSIDITNLTAGGTGDATIISTGGDIDLGTVVADGNAVALTTAGYDTDGTTVLHAGTITGNAPTASEIAWTAGTAPAADIYRNVPTISAKLLNAGDITFTSDNAVTLKSITTVDGSVNVTATDGDITATSVKASTAGRAADVALYSLAGDLVIGVVVANENLLLSAAERIYDTLDDSLEVLAGGGFTSSNANLIQNPGFEITAGLPIPTGFVTDFPYNATSLWATGWGIVSNAHDVHSLWASFPAHGGTEYLVINGGGVPAYVNWQSAAPVRVVRGLPYQFEAYLANASGNYGSFTSDDQFPQVSFEYSSDGGATWKVMANRTLTKADGAGNWIGLYANVTPSEDSDVLLRLMNYSTNGNGGDYGLDDLYFGPAAYATINPTASPPEMSPAYVQGRSVVLTAGLNVGDASNHLAMRVVEAAVISAATAYLENNQSLTLRGTADSVLDVIASSASSDIEVLSAALGDASGQVSIAAGRDLTVGDVQVAGGALSKLSKISLTAGRSILNANGVAADTILEANALSLSASSLDGTFDVSALDNIVRVSAAATGSKGVVSLAFNRANDVTLDGITALGGNVSVTNMDFGGFLIGSNGITAGSVSSANTVTLTTGGAIGKPTDVAEAQGTIFAASAVNLSALHDIAVLTRAGQLVATSMNGVIDITQTGNVKVAAGGINATAAGASVTLAVTGSILSGPGSIVSETATLSATTGMDVRTSVDTLSATSTGGNVTILETNGLTVGSGGISAAGGAVSLTLTKGILSGGGRPIVGSSVDLALLEAGQSIDVDTSASTLTASTAAGGSITIRNDKSFSVGAAGIVAGDTTADDVSIAVSNGGISAGTGSIKGDAVTFSATTGIVANTTANVISATSSKGDITLTQKGQAVTLTSVVASAGSVAVSNNDDLTVARVQAAGSGKNVSLTTSGTRKKIALAANSILADGDTVSLSATGGIDGTSNGSTADIASGTVVLASTGGDVTATVKASTVTASALGNDVDHVLPADPRSDLDLTILGWKSVFLGTSTGVNLTAAGDLTLHTDRNNIVVVAAPTAGLTTTYDTLGLVTYAVTSSSASGAGSLATVLANAGAATITGGGEAGVAFTTAIGSPIVLTSTIPVTSKLTLNGTQRINTTTGTLSTGRQVDIDGSRLVSGTAGFSFSGASDNSRVRGFAFYGFNKAGGAGVELAPGADHVTIADNLFGVSSTGRVSSNSNGIVAAGVDMPMIIGNTVVKSSGVGIKLTDVSNAFVVSNLVGTNATRTNLGNATGIQVKGTGAFNEVGWVGSGNVVAFNTNAGIWIDGADASGGGAATSVVGNEALLNGYGILVSGATKSAAVAGNTVTRNKLDGIAVNGTSQNVTIGNFFSEYRNYVGTNANGSSGLGNGRNGISVSSTGSGIVVQGNTVLGNGTANVADENAGVKFSGANSNGSSVTGNIINSNRGAGILAARTGTGAIAVTKNTISSNSGNGVHVKTGTVVVGGTSSDSDATLRANANTINFNSAYGVNVLASAYAQIAGNSMASNRLGGILNPNLTPAPAITSVSRKTSDGLLTVNFGSVANGEVVHVYSGGPQGRTYLGSFVYGTISAFSTNGTSFTMTLAQQQTAGVSATVFTGAPITGTKTSVGASTENTSAFALVKSITRVA